MNYRRVRAMMGVGMALLLAACGSSPQQLETENGSSRVGASVKGAVEDLLGPHVLGIDASRYQGAINWADLRDQGVGFAYLKASEGETVRNAYFAQHRDGARAAGVRWGAYHFVRPEVDPAAQLALFLAVLQNDTQNDTGDLPPVLDIETDGGLSTDSLRAHVRALAVGLEAAIGRRPVLYTGAAFYRDRLGPTFDGYPLWVAQYRDALPDVGRPWTLWQFTDQARLRAVGNQPVSLTAFPGTLDDLDAFARQRP